LPIFVVRIDVEAPGIDGQDRIGVCKGTGAGAVDIGRGFDRFDPADGLAEFDRLLVLDFEAELAGDPYRPISAKSARRYTGDPREAWC